MKRFLLILLLLTCATPMAWSQMYFGLEGLLHTPSAGMSAPASLRVGSFYLDQHFLPSGNAVNERAFNYFIALTPYEWVEASFMGTIWKRENGFYPDRSLSVKFRPLKEGRWWPALVVGAQDIIGSRGYDGFQETPVFSDDFKATGYYTNFFIAASKHFHFLRSQWGLHLAFRYYPDKDIDTQKARWSGLTGGITWSPDGYRPLRLVAEWDGAGVNLGVDACLLRILRLQLILQNFHYISAGICLEFKRL